MNGYVINFAVYTMAMLGLMFFSLMVYKKTSNFANGNRKNLSALKIEESMPIAPRKTLHIIKAGNERFLIASDAESTTLISKLQSDEIVLNKSDNKDEKEQAFDAIYPKTRRINNQEVKQTSQPQRAVRRSESVDELPEIVSFQDKKLSKQQNVIQNMLKKINQ